MIPSPVQHAFADHFSVCGQIGQEVDAVGLFHRFHTGCSGEGRQQVQAADQILAHLIGRNGGRPLQQKGDAHAAFPNRAFPISQRPVV